MYRFALFRLVKSKLPSYFITTGAGLFLILITSLLDLTLDTIGHTHSNSTQCMFDTSSVPANTLPISPYWLLIPDAVFSVGTLLSAIRLIEFILAQIPISLRGTMTGIAVLLSFIGQAIHSEMISILSRFDFNKVTPSCGFYYYLVQSILIMLMLMMFIIFAKRYKLRERERHVNIQAIVEEHYERYFDQEEEYMREVADMYKTICINTVDN